jgi:CheY-like chemotaxis protein
VAHKLLLADDSVTIQKVIELTFADEDITVIAVGDGRQAMQQAAAERPDIVLADVGMPEHDGYEVAAFIKNTPDLAHIPVLLLTGAFEPIDEGRARASRCDGVLVKPFEPQMVITRVKDLIAGRPPAQPASHGSAPAAFGRPSQQQAGVEDYFDHLDAAFAAKEGQSMAPQGPRPDDDTPSMAGLAEELANWGPDLTPAAPASARASAFAKPSTSAKASVDKPADTTADKMAGEPSAKPAEPSAKPPEPSASGPAPSASARTASGSAPTPSAPPPPSLAEAFAALLAAERGQPQAASAIRRDALPDDVVEQVTRRVLERIGNGVVREVVVEVAERLVREEIERIKAQA